MTSGVTPDVCRPRMRTIHRPCRHCGARVPFRVWRGFRPVARYLASPCPGCHAVSVLDGSDSWHRRAGRTPGSPATTRH